MEFGSWAYVGLFLGAAVMALVLTPAALRLAVRTKILDHPGDYKEQASPVPYLGGTAVVIAFAVAMGVAAVLAEASGSGLNQLLVILVVALALSLMGLIDDIRGLNPFLRIAVEVAAGFWIWTVGVRIELVDQVATDGALTILWVVGIMNAFNLLDNMDGLSAGTAVISAAFFFGVAALNGQFLVAAFAAAVAGCALGFLRHNFHPAKIYMGDSGSLFFGFILAVIGIKLRFDAPPEITFMVPVLILGVPIFDTTLVTLTRIVNRLNPLTGGRDHSSHRLVFVGIPVPATVALIYAGQISLGWLAIVMSRLDVATGYMLMAFVIAIGIFFGILLARVPVYDHSTRRRMMIQEVQAHEPGPKNTARRGSQAWDS